MITEERVMLLLAECNPVPEVADLDMSGDLATARLTELDTRRREMTELKSEHSATTRASGRHRLIVAAAVAAAGIVIAAVVLLQATNKAPVAAPALTSDLPLSDVDYVIDLNTGQTTPLPVAILGSVAPAGPFDSPGRYAASPDGSLLAYVGTGDDGSHQIFIAGIDGTGVRQVTDHPTDAIYPAWSPDGAVVAYQGSEGLFVLDVATGESTQVPGPPPGASGPQFTPDGSSLLYTGLGDPNNLPPGETSAPAILLTVPIDGGISTVLIGQEQGMGQAGSGSMSPDGSLVTMLGHKINGPGAGRFLADTDGSEPRSLGGLHSGNCRSSPAGTWSPDGSRIVCSGEDGILVVDVATGESSRVAGGTAAIWLDDHTLLVEA